MISLVEYAKAHGKDAGNLRRMAASGRFKTAQRVGRDWLIDPDEPFPPDRRITSGKYIKNRPE